MITPSYGITATERVLPKLALDFTTASLDPRVTFTRTTGASNPATYFDSSGYIALATNNQPRFDYNPVTLACRGLLIEESRSNLLIKSAALDDSVVWARTTVSVTAASITAPDNTLTGFKLESTSSGARIIQTVTAAVTGQHTFTAFCKYGNSTLQRLLVFNATTSTVIGNIQFNVQTGAIQATVTGSGSTSNAGNSWFRLGVTCSSITAGDSIIAYIYAGDTSNPAGTFCYAWGAQLELGAFATSYIPTTTAALTRNADVATMTGTNFSSWYNATQGTFSFWASMNGLNSTLVNAVADISDGTSNNRLTYYRDTNAYAFVSRVSAVTQAGLNSGTATTNTTFKLCGAYKLDNFLFSANAGATQSDTLGTVPTVSAMTIGNLGYVANQFQVNGHIQKIMYWPQALTSAEVRAFSK